MPTPTCIPQPAAPARCGEAGYSLIELLVVMVVGLIVVGLPLTLAVSSFTAQNESASRAVAASRAQLGLDSLVRDLRQAKTATITNTATEARAVLTIPTRKATSLATTPPATAVTWVCTIGATCTRQEGTGTAFATIPGIEAATFTPTYGTVSTGTPIRVDVALRSALLDVQKGKRVLTRSGASGTTSSSTVTFSAGVDLRNVS